MTSDAKWNLMRRISAQPTGLAMVIAALLIMAPTAIASTVFHVPEDFDTIQEAIDAAPTGTLIIVAPGTYNEAIDLLGKRMHLISSDGPEVTTIDAAGLNTSTVTARSNEGPDTVIEGFTITGGTGSDVFGFGTGSAGGGMFIENASPQVIDCRFLSNSAQDDSGGAIFIFNSGSPVISGCFFAKNIAATGGAILNGFGTSATIVDCTFEHNHAERGGAIANTGFSLPTIENCAFEQNIAESDGGAIFNLQAGPTIVDCKFADNEAWGIIPTSLGRGGAIYGINSGISVENATFVGNEAAHFGGAVHAEGGGTEIVNAEFDSNSAGTGGAMYFFFTGLTIENVMVENNVADEDAGGAYISEVFEATITNSVFSNNKAGNLGGAILHDCHFDFEGCSTLLISDSEFIENQASVNGGAIANLKPTVSEIADSFFCGNRPNHVTGTWVNLGGNEFAIHCPCLGDLNGDGIVDGLDLQILLDAWGPCANPLACPADLNGDRVVDVGDLNLLLNNWGCGTAAGGPIPDEIEQCLEEYGVGIGDSIASQSALLECLEDALQENQSTEIAAETHNLQE